MQYQTDDLRIIGMQESIAPEDLMTQLPLDAAISGLVYRTRQEIAEVIHRRDDRLMAVVGPCSIHDPGAAIDYAEKLSEQARKFKDTLLIVMRVYFEKPRTIVGWKGLINDPHLDNTYDINHGLATARELLLNINKLGLTAGTEYLDPITPQYVGDLVSWGAIGARTTESQIHRQLASGLSCPVGFKNSTDGSIQIAADAIRSSGHSHVFLSVTKQGHSAIFSTSGNPDCHIILRGGSNGTNYDADSIAATVANLQAADIESGIMVDMSHANSEKQHKKQLDVCRALSKQISAGNRDIVGVMIESNLVEGRQDIPEDLNELVYGQSITDACIDWSDTTDALTQLHEAVLARRG